MTSIPDDLISYTAINWLREFVQLAGRSMLPFLSGILQAILPSLATTEIETKSKKRLVNFTVSPTGQQLHAAVPIWYTTGYPSQSGYYRDRN